MALLLKSRDGDPSVGSNPTASESGHLTKV